MKFSGKIKKLDPGKKIILGGPEIARKYFEMGNDIVDHFAPDIDFLVVGEGDRALLSFVEGRVKNGRLAVYDEIEDIEDYPVPDYSDINMDVYPRKRAVSLMLSSGCIRKCAFCAERLLYKKFRAYPGEKIIGQIRGHLKNGIRQFVFHDSLINGDLNALENLCDAVIKEFGKINWEAQIAIRKDMPEYLFKKMKKSGVYHLFVGLESGCDNVLKKMNKGFDTDDALRFFSLLSANDISFGVSIITGFPGETEKEFSESLEFIVRNKNLISRIEQVNPFIYYDGIDIPPEEGCKPNGSSMERARRFVDRIDKEGFKYSKSFIFNLVETEWK
jgi:radical SAM superfamily enzyme YgiQ (UPF0313 family)